MIPLTPQGHFVPQLYHRTARGLSSLKTSSSLCNYSCTKPDDISTTTALQLQNCSHQISGGLGTSGSACVSKEQQGGSGEMPPQKFFFTF